MVHGGASQGLFPRICLIAPFVSGDVVNVSARAQRFLGEYDHSV